MNNLTQEEHTKASRKLILELAIKEFSLNGYKKASVNKICTEGNISKGRLFHHFKNKDDIFLSAARYDFEQRAEHIESFSFNENENSFEVLKKYFRHKQQYFVLNPQRAVLAYIVSKSPPEHLKESCQEITKYYSEKSDIHFEKILQTLNPPIPEKYFPLTHKILKIASYYAYMQNASSANYSKAEDLAEMFENNSKEFDEALDILAYGVYPRSGSETEKE